MSCFALKFWLQISLISVDNAIRSTFATDAWISRKIYIYYSTMYRTREEKAFPQNADLCLSRFSSAWDINFPGVFLSPSLSLSPIEPASEFSGIFHERVRASLFHVARLRKVVLVAPAPLSPFLPLPRSLPIHPIHPLTLSACTCTVDYSGV